MRAPQREPLKLRDAFALHLPKFIDDRGFFAEAFRYSWSEEESLPPFIQDNLSFSYKGVLRGLHFQRPPHVQAKLVTVLEGEIWDVIVDLRPHSPTYRQWQGVFLRSDAETLTWLYVPGGFAHGFYVRSERALVFYRCSAYYEPEADGGIRWDDPAIGIRWEIPAGEQPRLSPKDAALPYLADIANPFADV
jgi:dTDP-4-dehydrorhamnose 3,5-epimerase